jgi:hypothetical protein
MKVHPLPGLLIAALMLPAHAQTSSSAPAVDDAQQPAAASTSAARDALKQREGDTDKTTLLKQTLTAVDKQYSLIKRGKLETTYDLNYTYIGQERIDADFSSGTLTLFNIVNDSSHMITNTLLVDYGLRDNLTGSVTLPLVSKYSQNPAFTGLSHSVGDIGLGARWQPRESRRGEPAMTFTGNLRLPTGRSPFKVDANQGLATGSGVAALTGGTNANYIIDPVALFGTVNITLNAPAKHLSQVRGGRVLKRVSPGNSFGFGIGFAYALSYGISTSVALQEQISAGTKLTFADGSTYKTSIQTVGILNFGLGYRLSPKTTLNVTVGVGLTDDSPNLSIGFNLPLSF